MNKEQAPIVEKEKEITLEDVKEYFQGEFNFYSEEYKKARRSQSVKLEELYLDQQREVLKAIQDLREEKLKRENYERGLVYIEKILGLPSVGVEGRQNRFNLINHKVYGTDRLESEREDRDCAKKEYNQRKNYLRRLAVILSTEFYKDRKLKPVSMDEVFRERFFENIAVHFGKDIEAIRKEVIGKKNYEEVFEYIDEKIRGIDNEIEGLDKKQDKSRLSVRQEDLEKFRRYREFFVKQATEEKF